VSPLGLGESLPGEERVTDEKWFSKAFGDANAESERKELKRKDEEALGEEAEAGRQLLGEPGPGQEASHLAQAVAGLVDAAREEIVEDIAKRNLVGYTIAGGFLLSTLAHTAAIFIIEEMFMWEMYTEESYMWLVLWFWGYDVGCAWGFLFPSVFGPGHSALPCSGRDLLEATAGRLLELAAGGLTEGEHAVRVEHLRRRLYLRLDCVLSK
jgi:hypothetical protein